MIKDRWIICLASEDWGGHPSSSQHLIKVFAKHNKVLWIDSVGMRRPTVSSQDARRVWSKFTKFFSGINQVDDNLYVYTPVVIPFHEFAFSRWFNRWFLSTKIRQFRTRLKITNPLWWISTPIMASFVKGWENEEAIYYMGDDYTAHYVSYAELIRNKELEVMLKAKLTLVVSEPLYQKNRELAANILRVDHGVDTKHFATAFSEETTIPSDIADLPHPLIGYYGLIREWVDLELVRELALAKPDWSFVLIGEPIVDVSLLDDLPNVYLLGAKPHSELPAYIKAFDVGLIPYKVNELTQNANPLKMREYLASGKPVVSPDLPAVKPYYDVIEVAGTPDEFLEKIAKCLSGELQENYRVRQQKVASESWEAVAEKISQRVQEIFD